jgi:hypothetical protein
MQCVIFSDTTNCQDHTALVIHEWMSMEHWWNVTDRVHRGTVRNPIQVPLFPPQIPRQESNPSLHNDQPATIYLTHCTANHFMLKILNMCQSCCKALLAMHSVRFSSSNNTNIFNKVLWAPWFQQLTLQEVPGSNTCRTDYPNRFKQLTLREMPGSNLMHVPGIES